MRPLLTFAAAVALLGSSAASVAQPAAAPAVATRPADDVAKDAERHPAELIAFAGVKAGDHVLDVWPGGGFWSRLFSKAAGPTGKIEAYVPEEITDFKSDPLGRAKALAAEPGLGNVVAISDPLASQPPPQAQNRFDVVWTFENYHDLHNSFLKGASVDGFNRAVFLLLKPGGVYVIGDHAAAAGSGLKNTEDLHRIDPATVRAEVEKAGFRFDGELKVLAEPGDTHTLKVTDPAIRGHTDRFVYRFRKPS